MRRVEQIEPVGRGTKGMFRLPIIDRYLLKELSLTATAVTMILLLIFAGIRFIRFLAQAAAGKVPAATIFALSGYEAVGALMLLLPLGAFLAVILVLGRMANDNEVIALFACGVSRDRLLRVILAFGLVLATVVGCISLSLAPLAMADGYRLKQQALLAAETGGLVAGDFKEIKGGQRVFYTESLAEDRMSMEDVFIRVHEPEQQILLLRAARGHLETDPRTGDKHLMLTDGYRYDLFEGGTELRIARFDRHGVLVKKGGEQEFQTRHRALPTLSLWKRGTSRDIAEVQWRFSMPIATFLLTLLAVPLTRTGPRQGRYGGLIPAVLVYVIYSNMLGISRNWLEHESIPGWIGLWWIHALMLTVVLLLLWPRPVQKLLRHLQQFLVRVWRRSPRFPLRWRA